MIINRIKFNNFYRYYGEIEFDCNVNKEKNVITIIGENGRGKTTLLSAFHWVFYGKVMKPLTVDNMLNSRKISEMKNNTNSVSYVEVEIQENNDKYMLKRYLEFKKDLYGEIHPIGKGIAECYKIEKNGNRIKVDEKLFESRYLIPEDLSGFFFFDGERINNLAKVDGKKEIKNAILKLLGISHIERSIQDLSKVKRALTQELQKYSKGKDEEQLYDRYLKIEEQIKINTKSVEEIEDKINELSKEHDKFTRIIENSDNKNAKDLECRRKKLEIYITEAKKRLEQSENNIKRHISSNFKYYLLKDYIPEIRKIIEEKKAEGVLPSNIKETFIDDLILKKQCICGTCIEEGSKEYTALIQLKESAGSKELDDVYYNLKALIKVIDSVSTVFYKKLNDLIESREKYKEEIFEAKKDLENISEKLRGNSLEIVREAEKAREEVKKENYEYYTKKGKLLQIIEQDKTTLLSIDKEIKELKSNDEKIQKLNKKRDVVEELLQLNNDFKEMFTEVVRQELDARIKEVFANITNKDYRIPVLTEEFELKITSKLKQIGVDEHKKKDEVLSTGEGQITSLSFIGALVSYARDNKDDPIMSKLSGESYPIVMDSPFGNLDEIHTVNVAKNIGLLSDQVIIIVSKKQWEGHVKENIKHQVARCYRMYDGEISNNSGESTLIKEEMV